MTDIILERLARRRWSCPFDGELFDSSVYLPLHLCESHGADICQPHRIKSRQPLDPADKPRRLYCCLEQDCDFAAPPGDGITSHIMAEHPNPQGPTRISFRTCDDADVIDRFVLQQETIEARLCKAPNCNQIFADEARVAEHWVENHCVHPTVEEVRHAIEAQPERFQNALTTALAEFAEEVWLQHSARGSDDGYVIRHCPSVPRVCSKQSESIVYIERESVRMPNAELEELLECEGLDLADDESPAEIWAEGESRTIHIDLRFCNLMDGYIPRVKEVHNILPPLRDGGMVEMSWQEEPEIWFPCKVSKTKRAIYNLDGRLKRIFAGLPSGVRLYITRAGVRRYKLHLKHQPHIVRECKVFFADGQRGWKVEIRDEQVAWETGDDVFRHQLTFQQMEALREEARTTNLSVRDAVHEVMKHLGQAEPVRVKTTVYDAVFLWMRTCSLPAVWAQFRPEHECYVRIQPGWYSFDLSKPFPMVRLMPRPERRPFEVEQVADRTRRGHDSRIRIVVDWSLLNAQPANKNLPEKEFISDNSGETLANFLASLIQVFGEPMAERLMHIPVSRGHPLSSSPTVDFLNLEQGRPYAHKLVSGTALYVFTNTSNAEKRDDIRKLVTELGFPAGSVGVSIIPM